MADRVSLFRQLRAGYCHRWHANPELAGTETVAEHSARVARILLHFWPNASARLLTAALIHDDGEMGLGDVAGPAKRRDLELARRMDVAEAAQRRKLGLPEPVLDDFEARALHLADKLAGFCHVKQVRPDVLNWPDWQDDVAHMLTELRAASTDFGGAFDEMLTAFWAEFGRHDRHAIVGFPAALEVKHVT